MKIDFEKITKNSDVELKMFIDGVEYPLHDNRRETSRLLTNTDYESTLGVFSWGEQTFYVDKESIKFEIPRLHNGVTTAFYSDFYGTDFLNVVEWVETVKKIRTWADEVRNKTSVERYSFEI